MGVSIGLRAYHVGESGFVEMTRLRPQPTWRGNRRRKKQIPPLRYGMTTRRTNNGNCKKNGKCKRQLQGFFPFHRLRVRMTAGLRMTVCIK
jgi:hypothetical protein